MPHNSARFEEGTEILVDSQVETGATGWTLGYVAITRVGGLVAVHVEAAFANGAAAHVTTIQGDFAPGETVTTHDGKFTIGADGAIAFTGDTAAGARVVCEAIYHAGAVSP